MLSKIEQDQNMGIMDGMESMDNAEVMKIPVNLGNVLLRDDDGFVQESDAQIRYLSLDMLRVNALNNFEVEKDISDLAWSIRTSGLMQEPKVIPNGDGTYRILSGERRVTAIRYGIEQGWDWFKNGIPCIIMKNNLPKDKDQEMIMIYEANLRTRDNNLHYLERVKELYEAYMRSERFGKIRKQDFVSKLSKILGVGDKYAYKILNIAQNAPDWIRSAVDEGNLRSSYAMQLMKMDEESREKARLYLEKNGMITSAFMDELKKTAAGESNLAGRAEKNSVTRNSLDTDETNGAPYASSAVDEPGDPEASQTGNDIGAYPPETDMGSKANTNNSSLMNIPSADEINLRDYEDPDYGFEDDYSYSEDDNTSDYQSSAADVDYGSGDFDTDDSASLGFVPNIKNADIMSDAFAWFFTMSKKKTMTDDEFNYVNAMVKLLPEFYFSQFVKHGSIPEEMKPTIENIVNSMKDLI